jgi:dUTP pyrophosphatase
MLANSVGVIDSDYRGEVKLRFREVGVLGSIYKVGDRVGQIVFVPSINLPVTVVGTLSDSDRGEGGFGSTGA